MRIDTRENVNFYKTVTIELAYDGNVPQVIAFMAKLVDEIAQRVIARNNEIEDTFDARPVRCDITQSDTTTTYTQITKGDWL